MKSDEETTQHLNIEPRPTNAKARAPLVTDKLNPAVEPKSYTGAVDGADQHVPGFLISDGDFHTAKNRLLPPCWERGPVFVKFS